MLASGFKYFATCHNGFHHLLYEKQKTLRANLHFKCTYPLTHSYRVYSLEGVCFFVHTVSTFSDVYVPSAPTISPEWRRHEMFTTVLIATTSIYFTENSHLIAAPSAHTKMWWTTCMWAGRLLSTACTTRVLWGFMQQDVVRFADKDSGFCVGKKE